MQNIENNALANSWMNQVLNCDCLWFVLKQNWTSYCFFFQSPSAICSFHSPLCSKMGYSDIRAFEDYIVIRKTFTQITSIFVTIPILWYTSCCTFGSPVRISKDSNFYSKYLFLRKKYITFSSIIDVIY